MHRIDRRKCMSMLFSFSSLYYYLRHVNEANGGDNVFVRCVCVSVCVCAAAHQVKMGVRCFFLFSFFLFYYVLCFYCSMGLVPEIKMDGLID